MKKCIALLLTMVMAAALCACSSSPKESEKDTALIKELGLTEKSKPAAEATANINSAVYEQLDFENTQEADFAVQGLIDAPEMLELKDDAGSVIWSQEAYAFLEKHEKAPDTVNPSLWENTKNNHAYGLFKVTEGIYQVRGYDMANLTLIEGNNGWIIFDPLMSVECSQAAMQLVEKNLGKRPVSAIIISHPHIDHFGGIKGVISEEQVADASLSLEEQLASGKVPVIVPEDFEEHAVSENVYVGQAMGRRATYQYGVYLDPSENGRLAMGIGMGQSVGNISYLSPTFEIKRSQETYMIDGVPMEFQLTPGTEAPAEMNTWLSNHKALWVAENCTATLHNLYTLRGAQVRDGAQWAKYICDAITTYGSQAEVTFQSHNWPHWGNEIVKDYLVNTAAAYQFINDQTLTYINQGYTSDEISNMIELPNALAKNWYTRQYYGTVAHNSKAVYQKYMGWYDANPVHLNPLTPAESGEKWMEYMELSGVEAVLEQAKADFDDGQFQWVAEVTNKIVFADPENQAARLLCADSLEQLGYQAESGTWRNVYLTGAKELRNGNASVETKEAPSSADIQTHMTASNIFDYIGILLDKQAMSEHSFTVNFTLTDTQQQFAIRFKNGTVLQYENTSHPDAELSITTNKNALFYILEGEQSKFEEAAKMEGDVGLLQLIMENLNQFNPAQPPVFNIVEP